MINSTKIRARVASAEAVPYEAVIDTLAVFTETGVPFEAPVWTGIKELWCAATATLSKKVTKLVALEIDGHKYKVDIDHRFLVIRTKATRDREQEVYPSNESLAWIQASNMRIGDRLYFPAFDNIRKDWNKQDKHTGLGFIAVNKLRVQDLDEPVDVYSLTVSRYHHFLLPSGIISGA
jgi:intein/homing endonuclease